MLLRGVANSKRPKELCDRLLDFERLHGTLTQLISAEEKCTVRENQVTLLRTLLGYVCVCLECDYC